jgi:uncharacterized protein YwgA
MTTPDKLVADVLAAAGSRIVGRIRLQKIFYLLDRMGMGSGLSFHYHHYGPYSRELDAALDRAQAMHGVKEEIAYRQVDGMPYSIFLLKDGVDHELSGRVGRLPAEEASRYIASMATKSSTVLELAATIDWLTRIENVPDWKKELVRRKGSKTERGRMDEAVELLERFGLSPA